MLKTITIDGVEYEAKDVEGAEVEAPKDETVAPAEANGEELGEDAIEEVAEQAAEKIADKLGLKEILAEIRDAKKEKVAEAGVENKLIDLEDLMKKDVKSMTVREKIVGFFQGAITGNREVLKALSEGKLQHCPQ